MNTAQWSLFAILTVLSSAALAAAQSSDEAAPEVRARVRIAETTFGTSEDCAADRAAVEGAVARLEQAAARMHAQVSTREERDRILSDYRFQERVADSSAGTYARCLETQRDVTRFNWVIAGGAGVAASVAAVVGLLVLRRRRRNAR
jgi:hypothetical protein